jgi:hypothetical protein
MKSSKAMLIGYCVLLIVGTGIYIGARQIRWRKPVSHSHAAFIKCKDVKTGRIEVQLLPGPIFNKQTDETDADYIVRIRLKSNESLKKETLTQYMNFGISKNFFAVQGGHMLEQTACEKIPCINRNEFIYMTCFHRPALRDSNLLIYVADSLAGFGNSKFEFTRKTLQQLN